MYLVLLFDEDNSKEVYCKHISDSLEEVISYVKEAELYGFFAEVYCRLKI